MYVKQNEIMSYTVHSMDIFESHLLHATCDFCFVFMFIYFARIALLLILGKKQILLKTLFSFLFCNKKILLRESSVTTLMNETVSLGIASHKDLYFWC